MNQELHAHLIRQATQSKQRVPKYKYAVAPCPWSGGDFDEWQEVQDVARTAIHPSAWWLQSHMNGNGDLLYSPDKNLWT